MKSEKQIEETAKTLCAIWGTEKCRQCSEHDHCDVYMDAHCLHTAGYRKQSEVAREIFVEIDRMCIDTFGNFNHRAFNELKTKYIQERDS